MDSDPANNTLELAQRLASRYFDQLSTDAERARLVTLTEWRLRDAIYRACRKGGEGYESVMARAQSGKPEALLALLSVFRDAQLDDPIRVQIHRALREQPGFAKKYRKLTGTPRIHPHGKRLWPVLAYLCLNIELVKAHADGTMTLLALAHELHDRGLSIQKDSTEKDIKTFSKWLRRTFADIYRKS